MLFYTLQNYQYSIPNYWRNSSQWLQSVHSCLRKFTEVNQWLYVDMHLDRTHLKNPLNYINDWPMHACYVGIKASNCARSKPCQYKASHSIKIGNCHLCRNFSVFVWLAIVYLLYKSVHSSTGLPSGVIYLYSTIEIRTFIKGHSA